MLTAQVHNIGLDSSDLSFSAELESQPFALESIEPPFGPVEGGNRVAIRGRGFRFDDVPAVRFGGTESEDVGIDEDYLLSALVPPATAPGVVDVTVEDSRGAVNLERAYRYGDRGRRGLLFDGGQSAGVSGVDGIFEEGTIQLWIRRESDGFFDFLYRSLLSFDAPDGGDALRLEVRAGNLRLRTIVGGAQEDLEVDVEIGADVWRHVAITFSGMGRKIYLDGALVGEDGLEVDFGTTDRIRLGTASGLTLPFRGTVESVALWSDERFGALIERDLFVPVGDQQYVDIAWPLDEGVGQTARDLGRFGFDLTLGDSTRVEGSDPAWVEIDNFPDLSIESIEPASGPLSGGNRVAITGLGFPLDVEPVVHFGEVPAAIVDVVSPRQLEVEVPAGLELGPVDVSVTTSVGTAVRPSGYQYLPDRIVTVVEEGDDWSYWIGDTSAPPGEWNVPGYLADGVGWEVGPSGFGYGDNDDATLLPEMQNQALTLYTRHEFQVSSAAAVDFLLLRVRYDDGFVAWLNGVEIARRNVDGNPPAFDQPASDLHEIGGGFGTFDEEIDVSAHRTLLRVGANVLGIQVHNITLESSDLSLSAELALASGDGPQPGPLFLRGDTDLNTRYTVNDAVRILLHSFRGGSLPCEEAADVDDDGLIGTADAVSLLEYIFRQGLPPGEPFTSPLADTDDDDLECRVGIDASPGE